MLQVFSNNDTKEGGSTEIRRKKGDVNPSNWKQEMSETKNSEHEPNSNLLPVLWRRNKVKPLVKTNLKEKKKKKKPS